MTVDACTYLVASLQGFIPKSSSSKEHTQRSLLSFSFFFGLAFSARRNPLSQFVLESLHETELLRATMECARITKAVGNVSTAIGGAWQAAIETLYLPLQRSSPDTAGPEATPSLSEARLPYAGFIPGFVLGTRDPEFAERLLHDAIEEKSRFNDAELDALLMFSAARMHAALMKVARDS